MLYLASGALYMTDYYVVAPTVGEYSHQLGSNAALVSDPLDFSGWLFRGRKYILRPGIPLHFAYIVVMGRFFNGFGSARAINRCRLPISLARLIELQELK
jgi:hypothetical protein